MELLLPSTCQVSLAGVLPSRSCNHGVTILQELEELIEGVEADGIDVRAAVDAATEPAAEHSEQQVRSVLCGARRANE